MIRPLLAFSLVFSLPAFAAFEKSKSPVLNPEAKLSEKNENYFAADYLGQTEWDQQALQDFVRRNLTLPQSLVRSFAIMMNAYAVSSRPLLTAEDYQVIVNTGVPINYRNLQERYKNRLAPVVLLVGDDGASGVTELIQTYAQGERRRIVRITPGRALNSSDFLAPLFAAAYKGERMILQVENIERLTNPERKTLEILLKYRALLGDAAVVLTTESRVGLPTVTKLGAEGVLASYGLSAVTSFEPMVDSIHIVRRPQSPEYLRRILSQWMDIKLANLGAELDLDEPLEIDNESKFKGQLAKAAYDLQEARGHSIIRDLQIAVTTASAELIPCSIMLSGGPSAQDLKFREVVKRYSDAIDKALAAHKKPASIWPMDNFKESKDDDAD